MKLIIFILLFILPLYTTEASTDLAVPFQHVIRKKEDMGPSSQATLMTENNVGSLIHDRRLLFISSNRKSYFFATGIEQGLVPNTVMKLINISMAYIRNPLYSKTQLFRRAKKHNILHTVKH